MDGAKDPLRRFDIDIVSIGKQKWKVERGWYKICRVVW